MDSELEACRFHKHRWKLSEYSVDGGDQGWLWCCGRSSCWWCSRPMSGKRSSAAGSGRGRRGTVRKGVKSRSTPSEAKPGSLWTCGPAPSLLPAAQPRVLPLTSWLHQELHCTPDLHIQLHFDVDFQADFDDVRWHDVALSWNHTKDHNRSWKFCFYHTGHVPVIRSWNSVLHLEGGPIFISWIRFGAWVVTTWPMVEHDLARWTFCHFYTW